MKISLESLRPFLDGAIPAVVATSAQDGTPNVAYASQVHFVDAEHVALSYQFFSKTRENVLAHPYAQVQVVEPAASATSASSCITSAPKPKVRCSNT